MTGQPTPGVDWTDPDPALDLADLLADPCMPTRAWVETTFGPVRSVDLADLELDRREA